MIPFMEIASPLTGRRGVCLPFSDFSTPLVSGKIDPGPVFEKLIRFAKDRRWRHFEIRGRSLLSAGAQPVARFYGHHLSLTAEEEKQKSRVGSAVRRAIRKAQANGVTSEITSTREALLQFYGMHVRTRRRHGVPPQSKAFFLNLHRHIIEPGLGFVVLARRNARAIAGAVFFNSGRKALYKFGASDERALEYRPNNIVMWAGIRYLSQSGAKMLHFGRTELENDGLRRFKSGWGAREEMIEYFRFDTARQDWVSGRAGVPRFATAVFQRLPLTVNRLIGTVLYPHLD